jgi:hypothetical protein
MALRNRAAATVRSRSGPQMGINGYREGACRNDLGVFEGSEATLTGTDSVQ